MAVSAHNLILLFVTSSMLVSSFYLFSYNKFIILVTIILDFKTNFWTSWSLRSTDFVLWDVFLQISELAKAFSKFSKFFGNNVSITTISSFSFLKTPHRSFCNFFFCFFYEWAVPSLPDTHSWVKSCDNSSSSSSLPPFSLRVSPVESTVFLFWPEPGNVATEGSIFDWFWIEFWSKARSWVKFKFVKLLGVTGCRAGQGARGTSFWAPSWVLKQLLSVSSSNKKSRLSYSEMLVVFRVSKFLRIINSSVHKSLVFY